MTNKNAESRQIYVEVHYDYDTSIGLGSNRQIKRYFSFRGWNQVYQKKTRLQEVF